MPQVNRVSTYFTDLLNNHFWLVKHKLSKKHLLLLYIKRYLKLYFQGNKTRNLSCLLFMLWVRDSPVREAHLQIPFMPFPVVPVRVIVLCQQKKRNSNLWKIEKYPSIFHIIFSCKRHNRQDFLVKHVTCLCGWVHQGSMLFAHMPKS